jgi:hydroxyacylglutathione hydrolase
MLGYKSVSLSETVEVFIRPCRQDNFSYLIWDKVANVSAVVDAFSPATLVALAESLGAPITTALTTHHHLDHSGGNLELAKLVPGIEIVGSAYETAPGVTKKMSHGEVGCVKGGSTAFEALHTPCHTNGHLSFVTRTETVSVFTGDILFVGGCGRFFEGNGEDMEHSLNEVLAGLPDECLVFCGHEYTVSNLRFAASIDKENEAVKRKLAWACEQVAANQHTVPSTIGEEKTYNPFMRTSDPVLAAAVGLPNGRPAEVMAAIRARKDAF